MGNNNTNNKFNRRGDVDIILSIHKVCYYPGEWIKGTIKLIPKLELFEECKKHCELIIKVTQYSRYLYPVGSDYASDSETIDCITDNFRFSDFINIKDENEYNLPIEIEIPKYTRPSIYIDKTDYVKHYISIEYPHFNVKRTWLFIVKNHFKCHFNTRTFESPFIQRNTFFKKKFYKQKGSCQLTIKLPRNFFLYNERVVYNIHLDCRILQIPVYKIKVTFFRKIKKNFSNNITSTRLYRDYQLFSKDYNLDKIKKLFNIVDYVTFSDFSPKSDNNKVLPPSEIYQNAEEHGLYEIDDNSLKNLYPSCLEGLLHIEYLLKVKVFFDTVFTSDEQAYAPFDFCDIIDDNMPFQDYNTNQIDQIDTQSNINNDNINLYNNNINSNIISNDMNNINNPLIYNNIDVKKNYQEDKDWIIIDK